MPENEIPQVDDNTPLPQVREALKRTQARLAEAQPGAERAPALERENALLRAGGDPDSRVGRLLLGDDEVDWTDRDAVKAAWTEVVPPSAAAPPAGETPPPDGDQEPTAEERAQQQRREALADGAYPPGGEPSPDPWGTAIQEFHANRATGMDRERAAAGPIARVITAAVEGDERVIHDQQKWLESVQ